MLMSDDDDDDVGDDVDDDDDDDGNYWEKTRQTWWPDGARVESRLEGIVISIIGLLTNHQC